jgi:hypothetical protein
MRQNSVALTVDGLISNIIVSRLSEVGRTLQSQLHFFNDIFLIAVPLWIGYITSTACEQLDKFLFACLMLGHKIEYNSPEFAILFRKDNNLHLKGVLYGLTQYLYSGSIISDSIIVICFCQD